MNTTPALALAYRISLPREAVKHSGEFYDVTKALAAFEGFKRASVAYFEESQDGGRTWTTVETPTRFYAHYFASKARKFVVISRDASPVGAEVTVTGKADARACAARHNAKPYNF